MADVFISYRKADRDEARALCEALKVENLDVWWDEGLETGQTFDEKIQSALEQVTAVIVIWSKESVKSDWVRAESAIGRERGILVPVMIEPVNIPVPFNVIQTADLIGWNGDRAHKGYRNVAKQVKALAGKSHVKPLRPPPNPQLRALWRTIAAVAVIAAIGASTWVLRPWNWEIFNPAGPAAEAKAKRDASLAKLAAFGLGPTDLDLLRGREVTKLKFDDETYNDLQVEAANRDPAVLALQCAVALWGTASRQPDEQDALDICHDAAEAGDPAAHAYYGYALIEEKLYVGANPAALDAAAIGEFKKAADLGSAWGEVEYGLRLRNGEGVAANPIEAERLFKSAQAKGLPAADRALGRLYLSGLVGSPGDDEAFALVRKAADAGDPEAQLFLGEKLEEGIHIAEDLQAALAYYRKAAASDDPDIAFNAGKWAQGLEARLAREAAEPTAVPGSPLAAPAAPPARN